MSKYQFYTVDVFTNRAFGGNPLAVFTDARGLNDGTMQRLARELALSETTFVLPPVDATNDFRVRIFTPAQELPMAGHPTIGTAYVLAANNLFKSSSSNNDGITARDANVKLRTTMVKLEEGVGTIPVKIEWVANESGAASVWRPGFIEMSQPTPTFGARFEDVAVIAEMLSLDRSDIAADASPLEVVSCGVPFLIVPVKTLDAMRRIRFRTDVWQRALQDFATDSVFVFTLETEQVTSGAHSRMFAPAMNIIEDPATGSAQGPLGCYLVRHKLLSSQNGILEFMSEQGIEMGRPSFVRVLIEHNAGVVTGVRVGGECVAMSAGYFEID